jgi:hypothetical protein
MAQVGPNRRRSTSNTALLALPLLKVPHHKPHPFGMVEWHLTVVACTQWTDLSRRQSSVLCKREWQYDNSADMIGLGLTLRTDTFMGLS